MTDVYEMTAVADPGTVLDVITFADGVVSYQTGEGQSLVEARMRQLPSKADVVVSLSDWSNGYLSVRAVSSTSAGRIAGGPIGDVTADATGDPLPGVTE